MESFTQWDRFITPTVVKILYWIAMVVVVIAGIVTFFTGFSKGFVFVIQGLAMIVLGPIVVRIYAELILLGFRIYETMLEIRDKGAAPPTVPPAA